MKNTRRPGGGRKPAKPEYSKEKNLKEQLNGKPWLSVCLIFFIVPGLAPTYVEKAKFSLAGTDDLSRSCQEVLRGVNGRRFVENISPEFIRFLIDAYTVM